MSLRTETFARTARLEARITPDLHALLKRAAEIEGRTVTDFVVAAAQEAARRAVEAAEIIRLSADDQRRFAELLLDPPPPSPSMERAAARHRELIGNG